MLVALLEIISILCVLEGRLGLSQFWLTQADDTQHIHNRQLPTRPPRHQFGGQAVWLNYFLAGSAALTSFLAGSLLLAGALGADAAGAAGAATTAGLASTFFSSFLGASAAKAETANRDAIKVATNFIIFPF